MVRIGFTTTSVFNLQRRGFASCGNKLAAWGFIGLGQMGSPMARNLRAKMPKDDTLVIHDRNMDAARNFKQKAEKGTSIEIASTAREVAEKSETIITALPEASHIRSVFGSMLESPLPPLTQERLFIDCSTIDPISSREVANMVHSAEQGRFIDAPMSGGVVGAKAATLTFMVGVSSHSKELLERVVPILELMGRKVLPMGGQGMGVSAKLANNYILAISTIAVAEGMNLGLKSGLEAQRLGELINSSSGRCWASVANNPVRGISPNSPAEKDFAGGFGVGLMKKDLKLAMEIAGKMGAKLEMATRAREVYEAVETAYAGKDASVVYKWLVETA